MKKAISIFLFVLLIVLCTSAKDVNVCYYKSKGVVATFEGLKKVLENTRFLYLKVIDEKENQKRQKVMLDHGELKIIDCKTKIQIIEYSKFELDELYTSATENKVPRKLINPSSKSKN